MSTKILKNSVGWSCHKKIVGIKNYINVIIVHS